MKLHPAKIELFRRQLNFMGFTVGAEGLRVHSSKITKLRRFQRPTSKRDIKSLQGFFQFVRIFIPNLADKMKPLTQLLKKNAKFQWGSKQQRAFDEIRQLLNSKQCLRHPDFGKKFLLFVDASEYAIGGVLVQEHHKKYYFVRFASKTLNGPQTRYSATERECLAVVHFIEYFRFYLFGNYFEVVTDHGALRYLMKNKSLNARLSNWATRLSPFFFGIRYIRGTLNPADAPSRMQLDSEQPILIGNKSRAIDLHESSLPDSFGGMTKKIPKERSHSNETISKVEMFPDEKTSTPQGPSRLISEEGGILDEEVEESPENVHTSAYNNNAVQKGNLPRTEVATGRESSQAAKQSEGIEALMQVKTAEPYTPNLVPHLYGMFVQGNVVPEEYDRIYQWLSDEGSRKTFLPSERKALKKKAKNYLISGGELYIRRFGQLLLVPPPNERLKLCHRVHLPNHLRRRDMYNVLTRKFYWRKMGHTLDQVLESCETCNRDRAIAATVRHQFADLVSPRPFEEIEIDHVSIPDGWSRYLLVITDTFSGFTICFSVFSKALEYVALILVLHVFPIIGLPKIIRSDGGFVGNIIDAIMAIYDMKQSVGNPYHPQSQALVERTGGEIISRLARIIRETPDLPWEMIYPRVVMQHNTMPLARFDNKSRFEIAFGYRTLGLHDVTTQIIGKTVNLRSLENFLQYRENLKKYLQEITAKRRIDELDKMSTHHVAHQIRRGDLVYVNRFPGQWKGRKLKGNYYGPYVVVGVLPKGAVRIILDDGRVESVAAELLKKRPFGRRIIEADIAALEDENRQDIAEQNKAAIRQAKKRQPAPQLPPRMEDVQEQKEEERRVKLREIEEDRELQDNLDEVPEQPAPRRTSRRSREYHPRGFYSELEFPEEWYAPEF